MEAVPATESSSVPASSNPICPAKWFAASVAFDPSGAFVSVDPNNPALQCNSECLSGPITQQRHIGRLTLPSVFDKEVCGKALEGEPHEVGDNPLQTS